MSNEVLSAAPSLRESPAQSLNQLIGAHVLDYVPQLDLRHPVDPAACGCAFGMDGFTYLVFEDPSDGYRSCAAPLLSFKGYLYELGGSLHPDHLAMPVVCSMEGSGQEVLTVRDAATGKVVFEVGTDDTDDYYPSYVARWTPPGIRKDGLAR